MYDDGLSVGRHREKYKVILAKIQSKNTKFGLRGVTSTVRTTPLFSTSSRHTTSAS